MDISEQRHLKTQLELDVEALADYMQTVDNSDGHFSMSDYVYRKDDPFPCGTPSCALGHCKVFNNDVYKRLDILFYENPRVWDALFLGLLSTSIRTPAEWSAHARAWIAARK